MGNNIPEYLFFSRDVILVHSLTEFIEEGTFLSKRESIKPDCQQNM
jgi:hypothetical protein